MLCATRHITCRAVRFLGYCARFPFIFLFCPRALPALASRVRAARNALFSNGFAPELNAWRRFRKKWVRASLACSQPAGAANLCFSQGISRFPVNHKMFFYSAQPLCLPWCLARSAQRETQRFPTFCTGTQRAARVPQEGCVCSPRLLGTVDVANLCFSQGF